MRLVGSRQLRMLIVIAVTIGIASSTSASAASIGGFGVRPQRSSSDPATRSYFIVDARPGSRQHQAVVVTNHSPQRLVLDVNAVDGLTGMTSGVVYANRGVRVHSAGAWIRLAPRQVAVPGASSVVVHFAVQIPRTAHPGDHVAGISFEPATGKRSSGRFSVKIVVRAVIGVEFKVPGPADESMRLSSIALAPLAGTRIPSAVVTLADVGRKLCRPRLAVTIKGAGAAKTARQTLDTILPGDRIAYPFKWPGKLRYGRYDVSARATACGPPVVIRALATYSGKTAQHATQASQNLGTSRALAASPAAAASDSAPWLYGLAGLAVLSASATLLWLVRRRNASKVI